MVRRAATVAAVVAWAGLAHAQTPAFIPGGAPAPAATEGTSGSVITLPVPAKSLALGRARQVNKEGWVPKKK